MLKRLARACYHRRWTVLGLWVVVLVGLVTLNSTVVGKFLDRFELPGSDSQQAVDLLEEHGFDTRAGAAGQLVFQADDVRAPEVRQGMEALFAKVERAVAPGDVGSPYTPEGARQINGDGTIAYAEINMGDRDSDQYIEVGTAVRDLVDNTRVPGTRIELGGDAFAEA